MLKRSVGVAAVAAALVTTGAVASMSDAPGSAGSAASKAQAAHRVVCDGVLRLGRAPKTHVVVRRGDSCTLRNSTVKSLRARRGAVNVRVHDTRVRRNLMIRRATGTVHIGPRGCGFDPQVGNNVIVRRSHNVLICQMSVRNNLMVTGNDGRITIRDNRVRRNIRVNRNRAFAPYPREQVTRWADNIRLLHNRAGNHIVARDNHDSRRVVTRRNRPGVTVR